MSAPAASSTRPTGRRLPPYAREIADARRKGMVPARREVVVLLDRWRGFAWAERVVVPPGEGVDAFEFAFIRGLDALIAWDSEVTSLDRLNDLALAILGANPRRCIAIDLAPKARASAVFYKSAAKGVEIAL